MVYRGLGEEMKGGGVVWKSPLAELKQGESETAGCEILYGDGDPAVATGGKDRGGGRSSVGGKTLGCDA